MSLALFLKPSTGLTTAHRATSCPWWFTVHLHSILLFLFLNYLSFVLQRYKSCWDFPYTLMRQQGSKNYLQRGWPSEYLVCHIAMILSIPGTTNPLRETRQGSEHSNEVSDYWQTKYCCFLTTLEYNLMPFSQWEFF